MVTIFGALRVLGITQHTATSTELQLAPALFKISESTCGEGFSVISSLSIMGKRPLFYSLCQIEKKDLK